MCERAPSTQVRQLHSSEQQRREAADLLYLRLFARDVSTEERRQGAGGTMRPNRRKSALAATAVIAGWFATAAQGLHMVSSCKELATIPTPMKDDTHVMVTANILCSRATTIDVSGPYAYLVTSAQPNLIFKNVRFLVKNQADFFINLSSEESQGAVSFVGKKDQDSYGGAFKIDSGASATFGITVTFSGFSIDAYKRGGAIFNEGYLTFELPAKFEDNEIKEASDIDPLKWGCGGAVYNDGFLVARDVVWFSRNTAGRGSGGGALCNERIATFEGRAYLDGNVAEENDSLDGGEGGALYTGPRAETVFRKKSIFMNNKGGNSGGAVHTEGVTVMERSAVFHANAVSGRSIGSGGHVFSAGLFQVDGDASFRSGIASREGGALFVSKTGDATFDGKLEFIDNYADRQCHDVYDASSKSVCLSVKA